MADLIDQADLEQRIGPRMLAQLLDDDGDAVADESNVSWVTSTASKIAAGILRSGFGDYAQIEALVAADEAVKNDVVEIGCGLAGGRRPGLVGQNGKCPYDGWRVRAEKRLREVASAKTRAIGEDTAGANKTIATSVSPTRTPCFAATKANPQGGGGY